MTTICRYSKVDTNFLKMLHRSKAEDAVKETSKIRRPAILFASARVVVRLKAIQRLVYVANGSTLKKAGRCVLFCDVFSLLLL